MDRQDIDALLIGALYGELTPSEEARLTAHLESHPTDRGALDDLKVTRQAVLESRIFAVQVEPPQAISALLLQEAHHRAPKRAAATDGEQRESWFYRFTRVFLAHPAMAAAAMLVLVLGGAALMHSNNKGGAATKELAQPASQNTASAEQPAADVPTTTVTATPAAGSAAGSAAYGADLYEGGEADGAKDKAAVADHGAAELRRDTSAPEAQAESAIVEKKQASHSMAVGTSKGSVKELDRAKAMKADDDLAFGALDGDTAGVQGGGGGGAGAASATGSTIGGSTSASGRGATKGGYAQPPPAANKPTSSTSGAGAPATIAAPSSPPMADPSADAKAPAPAKVAQTKAAPKAPEKPTATVKQEAKPADSSLIAWAKSEHVRAVTLAQKGECSAAAKVALTVSSRASDYYAQYMATDRALKQCAQYINAEREKDAEKSAKARAQKRTNANEPANLDSK